MNIAKLKVDTVTVEIINRSVIPAGIIGGEISISFGKSWDELEKNAVFKSGEEEIICPVNSDTIIIPENIVKTPGNRVWVGFYGTDNHNGDMTPTIWADLGVVKDAASNDGDPEGETVMPYWPKLKDQIIEHENDKNNPHQVTASQAGTYSSGDIDAMLSDSVGFNDIPVVEQTDKQPVRRKQDGTLWTVASGVSSVQGKEGNVSLSLSEIDGDSGHRLVTNSKINEWDSKQSGGDFITRSDLDAKISNDYINEKLTSKIDLSSVPVATNSDTQAVRIKEDGSLWTLSEDVSSGTVDSVNGKTGDVILSFADIEDDPLHRIVSSENINAWNGKQPSGDYVTKDDMTEALCQKQAKGNYASVSDLNAGLDSKQPVGDYATKKDMNDGLRLKQNVGNYIVVDDLSDKADQLEVDNKIDKDIIPIADASYSQPIKIKPDGSLWTVPTSDGHTSVYSVNGKSGAVDIVLSDLDGDSLNKTVSDVDKDRWNAKQDSGSYVTVEQMTKKADKATLSTFLDKRNIDVSAVEDTIPIKIKPDGSLYVSYHGESNEFVNSINNKAGDVVLGVCDLESDNSHMTVTDTEISSWNSKLDSGNYVTNTIMNGALTSKQDTGAYISGEGLQDKLDTKLDAGDYATSVDLQIELNKKLDAGDYATMDQLSDKLDKEPIGEATTNDTQEVHISADGRLMVAGAVPTLTINLTVNTNAGAIVTAISGEDFVQEHAPDGVAVLKLPHTGQWYVDVKKDSAFTDPQLVEVNGDMSIEIMLPSVAHIYGAEWDGTANTKWARTDAASEFTDPNPAVNNGTGSSPFDNIMPWAGMTRVSDPVAGELVKIPKFYYKWTKVGTGLKLQICENKPDGTWFTSPAHMDREDGHGERDVVYVGRYHCAYDYKSTTGVKPNVKITRAVARAGIHALGEDIWQWDWHMHMTIWMLYLVEFADWNSQDTIGYGDSNSSSPENVGNSDIIKYHTGTPYSDRVSPGAGVQYRNIEGLWDNCIDWIDGCYYSPTGMNIINRPNEFNDVENGVSIGAVESGYPIEFGIQEVFNFQIIYPVKSGGSDNTYTCDRWNAYLGYGAIAIGLLGIGFVNYLGMSYTGNVSTRLMKLPNA